MAEPVRRGSPESQWFWDHYEWGAGEIIAFLEAADRPLEGQSVADVGCGDGIMALGVTHAGKPSKLVGYDIDPVDVDLLRMRATVEGAAGTLPAELRFERSVPEVLPAEPGTFDVAYTWSAFEHVAHPVPLLREIRRILKPNGVLFLQLWPFYHSERGSHLWDWFPPPFHHLEADVEDLVSRMRASGRHPDQFTEHMIDEFRTLNRITLDELQRSILAAGFDIVRVEAITSTIALEAGLARFPLSDLLISGVKLAAIPISPA